MKKFSNNFMKKFYLTIPFHIYHTTITEKTATMIDNIYAVINIILIKYKVISLLTFPTTSRSC